MLTRACLLAAAELLVFYILGLYLPFYPGDGNTSAADTILAGFLIYAFANECLAVVFTFLELPLMYFFYAEGIVVAFGVASSLIFHARSFGHRVAWSFRHHPFKPWLILVLAAMAGLAFLAVLNAGSDKAHTAAVMMTEMYHDAAGKHDILTGEELTAMTPVSLLTRWPMNWEFLSILTGISAADILHVTGSLVTAVLFILVVYRIGRQLFAGTPWKAGLFALLAAVFLVAFSGPQTRSGLFFREAYSGNSVLIFVLFPMLVLFGLMLQRERDWKRLYFSAFLAGVAGLGMSEISWFAVPAAILAVMLPASLAAKKWSGIVLSLLADVIPAAAFFFVYFVPSLPVTS